MTDSHHLLADYVQTGSDAAFRELVTCYVGLVYSTARRLVDSDSHRAEDVSQIVFMDLARTARSLPADVLLGGWLHRHTCFVAANTMRGERRRQSRERQAVEMNALQNESGPDYSLVAPILDEAIDQLGEEDRTAILLRFFEQHDFRSVGQALGASEDAARMRVNRALDKLQGLIKRRGVTTSAAALSMVLSANAVQAAPVGLVLTISTAAALVGTTTAVTATATATKVIAMTTLQKIVIGATLAAAIGTGIYEALQASMLRNEVRMLKQQQAPLAEQTQQLSKDRDAAFRQLAALRDDNERLNRNTVELAKLRGEVATLRQNPTRAGSAEEEMAQLRIALAKSQSTLERFEFEKLDQNISADMVQLVNAMRVRPRDYNGFMATNFDQLISELSVKTNADGSVVFSQTGNDLTIFEFMNVGQVNDTLPQELIFREKAPRRTPDGNWTRVYGRADGSIAKRVSSTGNFELWESVQGVPLQPQGSP